MKMSYHYFTFIIISLLLHYLFFYFTDTKKSVSFESEQVLNTHSVHPQTIATQSVANQVSKPTTPIVIADVDNTKSGSQISETATRIKTPNKNIPTLSATELNTEPTPVIKAEQAVQQREDNKSVIPQTITTQPAQLITSTPESKVMIQKPIKLSNKNYSVTTKTHKATESALLKAELFEQEIVNLPKEKHVKKKVVARSTKEPTKKPKAIAPKLTTSIAHSDKMVNHKSSTNTTIETLAKTTKPTFKPKVDTELPNWSNNIKLPQAVAISGKKPNYPQLAAKLKKKGQVVASMTVLPTGITKEAKIVKSSGSDELDQAVIEFIGQERFMPSLQGQDKISSKQVFSFSYE